MVKEEEVNFSFKKTQELNPGPEGLKENPGVTEEVER